jgi:hypothetical protein
VWRGGNTHKQRQQGLAQYGMMDPQRLVLKGQYAISAPMALRVISLDYPEESI